MEAGRPTSLPVFGRQFSGVKGLAHSRFGGPGEHNPCTREPAVLRPRAFSLTPRQHCKAFAAKRKFFVKGESGPPRTGSRRFRERKRSFMKFANISKSLLLGLALLLATSVFAAVNKG